MTRLYLFVSLGQGAFVIEEPEIPVVEIYSLGSREVKIFFTGFNSRAEAEEACRAAGWIRSGDGWYGMDGSLGFYARIGHMPLAGRLPGQVKSKEEMPKWHPPSRARS